MMNADGQNLLEVIDLTVLFDSCRHPVLAVDTVSFAMNESELIALVGESGSGKTTLGMSVLRILDQDSTVLESGKVRFQGEDLMRLPENRLADIRGKKIGFAFQEPLLALDPVFSIGSQIEETLVRHQVVPLKNVKPVILNLLEELGLDPSAHLTLYPHQLSGGMRQRAMLALAVACRPKLLIADEPTSALDAPLREKILTTISNTCTRHAIGLILITHNIGYATTFCHRLLVMYHGRLVEDAPVERLKTQAGHPYTRLLVRAAKGTLLANDLPLDTDCVNSHDSSNGCNFVSRCPRRQNKCEELRPTLSKIDTNHFVACWYPYRNKN